MDVDFMIIMLLLISLTTSLITGGLLVLRSILRYKKVVNISMNEDLEIIKVAQNHKQEEAVQSNPELWKEEIGAMEQLLKTVAHMKGPSNLWKKFIYGNPSITLEIANPADSEEIFFYISVPKKYRASLEKQVHSYFTDAQVEKVEDYTVFSPGGKTAIGIMKLKKTFALPIKTYEMMDVDPLSEITTAISKLDTVEEGACMQLIIQSAGNNWRGKGRKIAHEMQQGKQLKDVNKSILGKIWDEFFDLLTKSKDENGLSNKETVQLTPEEQELVKGIETKVSKTGFKVNIRLIASAKTQERADEILSHMENAFTQFENPGINHFQINHFKASRTKKVAFNYIFRAFNEEHSIILGTEEIASIFHFPISTTETPKITWLKAGSAPPPNDMPKEGILLGFNNYRGEKTDVFLSDDDRRRHLYVIGQTGVGKSTLLQEMAKQDVRNGKGLCFIDPHGDAIEDIFTAIPKERAEDVVYFDPADTERPFGLNMLEFTRPEEKTFVTNELINIFDKLYDLKSTGGPMFELYMRNAMLLVMEDEESGSTLMEIPKVLSDDDFRAMKLSKCKNQVVKDFWEKEAQKAGGEAALANMVPYITSKLTPFLTNDMMRPIISQQKSTIDFREVMDQEKILLINLSKGKIGETNSHLLGMIITGKLLMAALSRVDMPEKDRKDFYFYIDEFQNVTTDSISSILSEARKYRLALILAHQFIGQLDEDISKAVFGNVGSLAAYRVGSEDAEFLEKQFAPIFTAKDLSNVDNYNFFAKLLLNNISTNPFNITAYPPTDGSDELVPHLKELSSLKYGRDRNVVEQEVLERVKLKTPPKKEPTLPDESFF
jgi:hypothetical protein